MLASKSEEFLGSELPSDPTDFKSSNLWSGTDQDTEASYETAFQKHPLKDVKQFVLTSVQ